MIADWMRKVFGLNWKTTFYGILTGVPPIVMAASSSAGIVLGPHVLLILGLCTGLGALMMGLSAKDNDVHSTPEQVAAAGIDPPPQTKPKDPPDR